MKYLKLNNILFDTKNNLNNTRVGILDLREVKIVFDGSTDCNSKTIWYCKSVDELWVEDIQWKDGYFNYKRDSEVFENVKYVVYGSKNTMLDKIADINGYTKIRADSLKEAKSNINLFDIDSEHYFIEIEQWD